VLTRLVYAGGPVSGAHYNPAVTLAFYLRARCPAADLAPYWLAQFGGATLAALTVGYLRDMPATGGALRALGPAFLAEFLFTFVLVWVILHVSTTKGPRRNAYDGLAIGLTVMAGAFAVGDISGGVFNPAVAVAMSVMRLSAWSNLWVFLAANVSAGVAGALLFNAMHPADR
jgi:aquaporin Z